tara:strand:- start:992 stop:1192 length:201 start_codon:yes stop_codon:yes gene_type:complete
MRKRKGKKSVESRTNNRQKDQKEQRVQKKKRKVAALFFSFFVEKRWLLFSLSLSRVLKKIHPKNKK